MKSENSVFDIKIETDVNNIVNIYITGELSFTTVPVAYDQTKNCFNKGQDIQVNLNDVRRTDSAAMALILEWSRLAKTFNTRLKLNNIPDMLQKIASVSDLEELL